MGTRVTQAQWDAKRAEAKAKAREALLQDAAETVETVEEDLEEVVPYTELSDEDLLAEVQERDLDISEVTDRAGLIAALEADDESEDE